MVLVSRDHKNSWDFVKKQVPEAKSIKNSELDLNFVRAFTSAAGHSYVFINLQKPELLEKAFATMKAIETLAPITPVVFF
jgi:hypothetical protein